MFTMAGDRAGRGAPFSLAGPAKVTISDQVLQGTVGLVTIANIPQNFRDLELVITGRGTSAVTSTNIGVQFNGDAGSNYSWVTAYTASPNALTAATVTGSTSIVPGELVGASAPSNIASSLKMEIPNYAGTTFQKSAHTRGNLMRANSAANLFSMSFVGWWLSTAAINQLAIFLASGSFAAGTAVSLYGVGGTEPYLR